MIRAAVYAAVSGASPGEEFVAYPVLEYRGLKGARKETYAVRCCGRTADEAEANARKWWEAETEKERNRQELAKKRANARAAIRSEGLLP